MELRRVSYGWLGRYGDFPILGLVLGVLHNLFAIQVYERRGKGFAVTMILVSILVAVGAFVLLLRLLGEI